MSLIDELRNDIAGAQILADWLGEGGEPVAPTLAHSRALACVSGNDGNPCPHNVTPNWLDTAKGAIADAIRKQLEAKMRLNISTPLDVHIFMCRICGCSLRLKVWTPTKHIAAHTSEAKASSMPAFCWQRQEIENL